MPNDRLMEGPLGLCVLLAFSFFFPDTIAIGSFGDAGMYKIAIESIYQPPSTVSNQAETAVPQTVTMFNRKGQAFRCSLPPPMQPTGKQNRFNLTTEEIRAVLSPKDAKIPAAKSCISLLSNGWWHYEYCISKHVQQFHIEKDQIIQPIITLGTFSHDFDWSQVSEKDALKSTDRAHIQYFVNGTECDLTGKRRATRVRLYCNPNTLQRGQDFILSVDEPESCVYEMSVFTSRLCQIEYFNKQPQSVGKIVCSPVISKSKKSPLLNLQSVVNEKVEDSVEEEEDEKSWDMEDDYDETDETRPTNLWNEKEKDIEGFINENPWGSPPAPIGGRKFKESYSSAMRSLLSKQKPFGSPFTAGGPPKSPARSFGDVLSEMNPAHRRIKEIEKMLEQSLGTGGLVELQVLDFDGQQGGRPNGIQQILQQLNAEEVFKFQNVLAQVVVGEFGGVVREQEAVYTLEDNYNMGNAEDEEKEEKERQSHKIDLVAGF